MQHKHWAVEAGVESNCRAKIQLLFIHQILWMNPSDYRRTSHFTREWESTLIVDYIGICLHQQDAETSEVGGLDLEPLVSEGFLWRPQAPLPILSNCSQSCVFILCCSSSSWTQKGCHKQEEHSSVSLLWVLMLESGDAVVSQNCGGNEGSASVGWLVRDSASSHFLQLCANVEFLKG